MLDRPNTAYPIREDMDFQRRDWLAERIGWAAVAVTLSWLIIRRHRRHASPDVPI